MTRRITAEMFEAAVGHPPENDDLERANCPKAGQLGHFQCGWDTVRNLPVFMVPAFTHFQEKSE